MLKSKMLRGALKWGAGGALLAAVAGFLTIPSKTDYCNVALVPELAEKLGADLSTRLLLAGKGSELLRELTFSTGDQAGEGADGLGETWTRIIGGQVYEMLRVDQRRVFFDLFREGRIIRIDFETKPSTTGAGPDEFVLQFGWKDLGKASLQTPLIDVKQRLDRAWEQIPSETVARKLLEQGDETLTGAAEAWLAEHAAAAREKVARRAAPQRWEHDFSSSPPASAAPQRSAEERRADFERRSAEMRGQHEERARETRARHEERTRQMRQDHEERVREMREKHARQYGS